MRLPALLIAAALLLAACGTKGSLTLPPKPSTDPSTKTEAGR